MLADGAAYDPLTDTWRRLAPAPIRAAPSPALGARVEVDLDAAWTGTRMLVWNGIAGAAYEPRKNAWKPVAPPPPQPWLPEDTAVWTGIKMLIWGGCWRGSRHHRDGALYSPR